MKINIITIQYAHNYGAVLQAYSLKNYLINLGHEVVIVNYIPEVEQNKYGKKLKNQLGKKQAIREFRIIEWIGNEIDIRRAQPEWEQRHLKFNDFIQEKLTREKQCFDPKDLDIDTDVFICGSDQIWNPVIAGKNNPFYFLNFDTRAKKISYAASMGNPKAVYSKEYITKVLSSFNAISVREEGLKELLENYYDIKGVFIVSDPCLLLHKDDFLKLIPEKQMEDKPFACVYYINDSGLLNDCFNNREELNDERLIEIRWVRNYRVKNQNQRVTLSVGEFLWYVLNCDVLYTDSFHGIVFSLLFHKKFFAVYNKNERIDSLLSLVGLKALHISSLNEASKDVEIVWENVDKKIDLMRTKSQDFLLKGIEK